ARKPAELSFAEAAGLPIVYMTAAVDLERLARLEAGETVLIHAGAGGVGIAAIQLAQRLGATVIATTSTEDKRAFLRGLGVEHIFHSRTPKFRQDVMKVTGGRGVDVVLNSLSGRSLTQSLHALAPFGRFVEIGKTDIYQNRQIGLQFFGENRSYACLDINRWIVAKKPQTAAVLGECMERVAAGTFKPLPIKRFPIAECADALQFLAQARHIGKVIVDVPERGQIAVRRERQLHLDSDGAFLITGGCSGFGLAIAGRLVDRGARHLVLLGRRGLPGQAEQAAVVQLRERGAEVLIRRCDVGERDQVAAVVAEIAAQRPIVGIIHAAVVLDDGPIASLDRERYQRVSHAKVGGAWNLHLATLPRDGEDRGTLRHFVLLSSIASIIGTPGQANYAAANAVLDRFAAYRRSLGLPATVVNWGVIDVGVVARASNERRRKILGQGVAAFTVGEALDLMERMLVDDPVQRIAADIDWSRLGALGAGPGRPGRFAALAEAAGAAGQEGGSSLRETLLALPDDRRIAHLGGEIAGFVAHISGQRDGDLDREASMSRFGLDSLMANQLQTWLDSQLGVVVPLIRLLRGPSIIELARQVLAELDSAPIQPVGGDVDDSALVQHLATSESVRARLFCFPYMAGTARAFAPLAPLLGAEVAVDAIVLPAVAGPRDALLRGEPQALRAALVDALVPLTDTPFAFYGHSMGGWVALDVAAALYERTGRTPAFVALGAMPTLATMQSLMPSEVGAPEDIDDAYILAIMERMQVSAHVLDDPALRVEALALARRDLWLGVHSGFDPFDDDRRDSSSADVLARLPCLIANGQDDPIATVDGAGDGSVDDAADGPSGHRTADIIAVASDGPVEIVTVPGGHLFLDDPGGRSALLEHLRVFIHRYLVSP
ncbi:MAG: SDR family NAD(P)-dependent oxidoreductase, partial [Myxococcota bacterium]